MFSPISMFLFIMTPRHLDTTKFKISISIWAFGYNAFTLSIPFVSSTIRILFTNIPLITTRKVRGRSWSHSISTADTMSEMILFCFYYSKKLLCLENSFEFIWNPNWKFISNLWSGAMCISIQVYHMIRLNTPTWHYSEAVVHVWNKWSDKIKDSQI